MDINEQEKAAPMKGQGPQDQNSHLLTGSYSRGYIQGWHLLATVPSKWLKHHTLRAEENLLNEEVP